MIARYRGYERCPECLGLNKMIDTYQYFTQDEEVTRLCFINSKIVGVSEKKYFYRHHENQSTKIIRTSEEEEFVRYIAVIKTYYVYSLQVKKKNAKRRISLFSLLGAICHT